jgi:hypothetical protein
MKGSKGDSRTKIQSHYRLWIRRIFVFAREQGKKGEKSPLFPCSLYPLLHLIFTLYSLLFTLYFSFSPASAQSLTIETGLGYVGKGNNQYLDYFKVGAKAFLPVSESVDLYVAPHWMGGFGIDAGTSFKLPLTIEDLEGFRSYVGTGLSLIQGRFGFALSAAVSYDLSDRTGLVLTYTHRPLLSPGLSQAFDVSLGINVNLR